MDTIFFTIIDMVYYNFYIIKVVLMVDLDESKVTPITINYINIKRLCQHYSLSL